MKYSQLVENISKIKTNGGTPTISDVPIDMESLSDDFYRNNIGKISTIIKESHDIKVTTNIIDTYIDLAKSHIFTTDTAVHHIRESNIYDRIIDGKIHYRLNDGSIVAISEETQTYINSILNNNKNAIEYMQESSSNFLKILKVIIKEQ